MLIRQQLPGGANYIITDYADYLPAVIRMMGGSSVDYFFFLRNGFGERDRDQIKLMIKLNSG